MKHSPTILLICLALFAIPLMADDDDAFLFKKMQWNELEMPFYKFSEVTPQVALRLEYAKFEIENMDEWLSIAEHNVAYEIDLVFTKYPRNIKNWRTNYFQLLNDRLKTLFEQDSTLLSPKIKWNMILQTQCKTEEEAKKYFHGFVVKYRPKKVKVIREITAPKQLRELISGNAITADSTVFKIMDRNPHWGDMLVVMDWTGSMYKYGAQLVLWHKLNMQANESKVKHFVFFNDGNNRKTWQKKAGKTGGVYRAKSGELDEIVSTMEYVMKKGNGGDSPENDLEAILTGTQYLDGYDEVILIADNKSDIRDISLLEKIDRPIRIILCDIRGKIHPHYIKLAEKTGGSIHTLKKDILRMKN